MKLKIKAFSFVEVSLSMAVIGIIAVLLMMNIIRQMNANDFRKKGNTTRQEIDKANYSNRIRGEVASNEVTYAQLNGLNLVSGAPQRLRVRPVYTQKAKCTNSRFHTDRDGNTLTFKESDDVNAPSLYTINFTDITGKYGKKNKKSPLSEEVADEILEASFGTVAGSPIQSFEAWKTAYPQEYVLIHSFIRLHADGLPKIADNIESGSNLSCQTVTLEHLENADKDSNGNLLEEAGKPVEFEISPTQNLNNVTSKLLIKVYDKDWTSRGLHQNN